MTIGVDSRRIFYYGNGITTLYPFSFKVFTDDDLVLIQFDPETGPVLLTLNFEYTVTLNGDQDNEPGGFVTMIDPLPDGHQLTIVSSVPYTQEIKITNAGGFYPAVVNDGFDKLTVLVQQVKDIALNGAVDADANLITAYEKRQIAFGWGLINSEYVYIVDSCTNVALSTTAFSQSYQDLSDFITPVLANLNTDSLVSRALYNSLIQAFYIARAMQLNLLHAKLNLSGAPAGTYVNGVLSETLTGNVATNTTALNNLSAYQTITPPKKDLLKPGWDAIAKQREKLVALATPLDISLTVFNAAYADVYALAFDLFGLSSGDHFAYSNRNTTTSLFDFDAYKVAIQNYTDAAIDLMISISSKNIDAVTLAGREDWEYVQSNVGVISIGMPYDLGATTVTSTLTTKPGSSSATNTWVEIVISGKKYWLQAWEDEA